MTMLLRGADVLARTLARAGTRYLFSLSGNQVMPIYDAALDAGLEIIHVRHEGAAVHMADAWGRLTGNPGIALVTGGPGHANAVGALFTAAAADSPLILLSGHAPLNQLGMDAFQEMAQAEIAAPLVKASWTARSAADLGTDIARAWRIALSGRAGPVHISLPFDVLEAKVAEDVAPLPKRAAFDAPRVGLDANFVQAAAAKIAHAKRPLILTGPQMAASRCADARAKLSQALGIPVIGMESPRGVNDPALGAFAEVLREADLVLLLGKKLDFTLRFGRVPAFAVSSELVQIDPDEASLSRARIACGDAARIVLAATADPFLAAEQLAVASAGASGHAGWLNEVEAAIRFRPAHWDTVGGRNQAPLHPAEVGRAVGAVAGADSIMVIDGGEFGQWAQACVEPKVRLINGPAGSIGSALPFALAAKLWRPQAQVIALLGDGTFGFHLAELDTAVRHRLPIVAVVGNDACWNAEHQIQLNAYGRERAIGCELLQTRYDQAAMGLGARGALVETSAQLRPALAQALASGEPTCVNVLIERLAAPNVVRNGAAGPAAPGH